MTFSEIMEPRYFLEGQTVTILEQTVRRQVLGTELRILRKAAHFTLEDAAQIINCSASLVSRMETGHRSISPVEVSASTDRRTAVWTVPSSSCAAKASHRWYSSII